MMSLIIVSMTKIERVTSTELSHLPSVGKLNGHVSTSLHHHHQSQRTRNCHRFLKIDQRCFSTHKMTIPWNTFSGPFTFLNVFTSLDGISRFHLVWELTPGSYCSLGISSSIWQSMTTVIFLNSSTVQSGEAGSASPFTWFPSPCPVSQLLTSPQVSLWDGGQSQTTMDTTIHSSRVQINLQHTMITSGTTTSMVNQANWYHVTIGMLFLNSLVKLQQNLNEILES